MGRRQYLSDVNAVNWATISPVRPNTAITDKRLAHEQSRKAVPSAIFLRINHGCVCQRSGRKCDRILRFALQSSAQ